MSILEQLETWFAEQCDGDWEHKSGISIESCDNPGWWVKIDLKGTSVSGCSYPEQRLNIDEAGHPNADEWLHCLIKDNVWQGAGDPSKLEVILESFLEWTKT